jgi:hypothetical protein
VADEITDDFDRRRVRKFNAREFIFDQYQQFELLEPVNPEIVAEVCFINNLAGVYSKIIGNELSHFGVTKVSYVHRFPTLSSRRSGLVRARSTPL